MNKVKRPLVSVIMPVYNAEDFLVEAIESILGQTYPNFELLIVDDASTDNSWQIIQKFAQEKPKIVKAFHLNKNTNAAGNGAVNKVLPHAKGQYLARMDADDVALPQRLEKQVEFLEKNPGVILVGTQALVINGEGKIIGKKTYPLTNKEIYKKYAVVHPIIHPTCMIRRSALPNKNKLYRVRFGVNDDYYTFFGLQKYGQFANLPEFLLKYRVHNKNSSFQNLREKYAVISKIRKTAVKEFGYKISLVNQLVIFGQDLLVKLIPEDLLTSAYLVMRGIGTKDNLLKIVGGKVNLAFAKASRYVLSLI